MVRATWAVECDELDRTGLRPRKTMVRVRGLEPPRGCPHTDLNRTRLPIPPHPHVLLCRQLLNHTVPPPPAQAVFLRNKGTTALPELPELPELPQAPEALYLALANGVQGAKPVRSSWTPISPLIYTPRAKRFADTEDLSAPALSSRECGERILEC